MHMKKGALLGLVCCAGLASLSGCLFQDPLISGGLKVAGGTMTTMTVAEVQAVSSRILDEMGAQIDPLTTNQAQAVVYFLNDNNLNSISDVQTLIANPEDIVVSQRVLALVTEEEMLGIMENFGDLDLSALGL